MKNFTIIIPIFNEIDSIFDLIKEIEEEFSNSMPEVIIVNDGSTDKFREKLKKFKQKSFKVVHHDANLGKCKAMLTGVIYSKNQNICVMDGDGQNPPYEAKNLMNFWIKIDPAHKNFALVCGNRLQRQDTVIKKISSKIANTVRRLLLNDECNDTGCALKVFSKEDYLRIDYFRNMHRFLPAIFKMNSGKIFNVAIVDRKRVKGKSKYSFNNRFWVGILDLIKVWLMIFKRRKI